MKRFEPDTKFASFSIKDFLLGNLLYKTNPVVNILPNALVIDETIYDFSDDEAMSYIWAIFERDITNFSDEELLERLQNQQRGVGLATKMYESTVDEILKRDLFYV